MTLLRINRLCLSKIQNITRQSSFILGELKNGEIVEAKLPNIPHFSLNFPGKLFCVYEFAKMIQSSLKQRGKPGFLAKHFR